MNRTYFVHYSLLNEIKKLPKYLVIGPSAQRTFRLIESHTTDTFKRLVQDNYEIITFEIKIVLK